MKRQPNGHSRSRSICKLDRASVAILLAWQGASSARAQTYDPAISDIQITHTPGVGATQSEFNDPYITLDVPGQITPAYVAPAGTAGSATPIFHGAPPTGVYQLESQFFNPAPFCAPYSFPNGGPAASSAFASVGETAGNGGLTSVILGAGAGVTQTNPPGPNQYGYASQLTVNIQNLAYQITSTFPSNGIPTVTYAFPVAGVVPSGGSVSFDADFNYLFYPSTLPASSFSIATAGPPQTLASVQIGSNFSNNTGRAESFTALNSGLALLNNGVLITQPGYLDVVGSLTFQSIVDSPTYGSNTQSAIIGQSSGASSSSIPSAGAFQLYLSAPGTATASQGPGNTFLENGGGGQPDLDSPSSWTDLTGAVSGAPGANDIAQFDAQDAAHAAGFQLTAATGWGGLSVVNPGNPVILIGSPLSLGAYGITVTQPPGAVTETVLIDVPLSTTASQVWSVASGQTLTISGTSLNLGTSSVTITGGGTVDIASPITGIGPAGTAALVMNGSGTLTLSGSNAYTGGTTLNSGEVSIASDSNIGGPASAITFNGGALQITGTNITNLDSHLVNWNSFSGGLDIANASNTFTVSANIGNAALNSGSLTKYGAGTLVLTANNSYTGPTTINGGGLVISSSNNLSTISQILVNSPGGLVLSGGDNSITLNNPIFDNVPSGQFLIVPSSSNPIFTLNGNVTTGSGDGFSIDGDSNGFLINSTIAVTSPNVPVSLSGAVNFGGNASLTANLSGLSSIQIGSPTSQAFIEPTGSSSITNLGNGGAIVSDQSHFLIFQQASVNLGAGPLILTADAGGGGVLGLLGGNLTTSQITVVGGSSAYIQFGGGVLTASASNTNFLPSGPSVTLNVGTGVVINTNGFNDTLNPAPGFVGFPGDGGVTKNGAGQLLLSQSFGSSQVGALSGPTTVNGGLLEISSFSQLGNTEFLQVNAGGAFGDDEVTNLSGLANFIQRFRFVTSPSGALALTQFQATAGVTYTGASGGFDMTNSGSTINFTNMSIGAVEGTNGAPVVFTGNLTPGKNALTGVTTYQLGGGGTLEIGVLSDRGGPTNLLAENGGTVWLNSVNTYSGTTTIQGTNVLTIPAANSPTGQNQFQLEPTTLDVSDLADGTSSLGNSNTSNPANLVINGGVLEYLGTASGNSSRLFTIGQFGATLKATGGGGLRLSNTGTESFAAGVTGAIALTLTGINQGELDSSVIPPAGVTVGLVKNGLDLWVLSGSNTFASVSVNQGELTLFEPSNINNFGGTLLPVTISSGASLELFGYSTSIGALSGGGVIMDDFGALCALSVGNGNVSGTFGGAITNGNTATLGLLQAGTGNLTLTGNTNTYSGGTTVSSGGTLTLTGTSSGGAVVAGTGPITNNGLLTINRADSQLNLTNLISGPGSILNTGPGTVVFSASNTFTGGITIAAGTVQAGSSFAPLGNGLVTITGGLLDLHGNNVSIGSLSGSGAIDNLGTDSPGTLTINNSANNSFTGTIANSAGSTALVKNGAGILMLAGQNTYAGGTTINAGTLDAEGPSPTGTGPVSVNAGGTLIGAGNIAGSVSINSGGVLSPGAGGVGALTVGALTLNTSSTVQFGFSVAGAAATSENVVTVVNGLNIGGAVDLDLVQQGTTNGLSTPGTYALFQVAGAVSGSVSEFLVADAQPLTSYSFVTAPAANGTDVDVIVQLTPSVYSFQFNGGTAQQNTDLTLPNWFNLTAGLNDGLTPGSSSAAQFDGTLANLTASTALNLSSAQATSWAGLSVQTPGPSQFVSGGVTAPLVMTLTGSGAAALSIGGVGINVAGTDTVIGVPVALTAPQTWNVAAVNALIAGVVTPTQTLTLNRPLNLGGNGPSALSISGTGNATIAGTISDGPAPSGITTAVGFSGTLTLSGRNTYSGGTTLNGGTLAANNPSNLGAVGSAVNFNGGTLQVSGALINLNNYNVNAAGAGPNAVWQNFPLNIDIEGADNTFTVSQTLTGNLSVTESGNGVLAFTGTNSYTGGTTITGGILQVPTLASLGTGPLNINGGAVMLTGADAASPNTIVNNATLSMTGNTTLAAISGNGTAIVASNVSFYADDFAQSSLVNNGVSTIGCAGTVGRVTGAGQLFVGAASMVCDLQLIAGGAASTQSAINVQTGSSLDITNNKLVINFATPSADPAAAIAAALTSGYCGGLWTGPGINSSLAAGSNAQFAVGYLDGDNAADRTKSTVAKNQLIIQYTLTGDADLEGSVGFDDLVAVAENFGKVGEDWAEGNFNYDPNGSVGFADLVFVAENFGATVNVGGSVPSGLSPLWESQSAQPQSAQSESAVPEPAGLGVVFGLSVLGLRRQRKTIR